MSEGVGGERGEEGKKGGREEKRERMEDAGKRDEGTFIFFYPMPIMGNRWAPARASIFRDWKKIPTAPGTGQS